MEGSKPDSYSSGEERVAGCRERGDEPSICIEWRSWGTVSL